MPAAGHSGVTAGGDHPCWRPAGAGLDASAPICGLRGASGVGAAGRIWHCCARCCGPSSSAEVRRPGCRILGMHILSKAAHQSRPTFDYGRSSKFSCLQLLLSAGRCCRHARQARMRLPGSHPCHRTSHTGECDGGLWSCQTDCLLAACLRMPHDPPACPLGHACKAHPSCSLMIRLLTNLSAAAPTCLLQYDFHSGKAVAGPGAPQGAPPPAAAPPGGKAPAGAAGSKAC